MADGQERERDVMKEAAENLASVKKTLAAIDDLNKRWEVKKSTCMIDSAHALHKTMYPPYIDGSEELFRGYTCISGVCSWSGGSVQSH